MYSLIAAASAMYKNQEGYSMKIFLCTNTAPEHPVSTGTACLCPSTSLPLLCHATTEYQWSSISGWDRAAVSWQCLAKLSLTAAAAANPNTPSWPFRKEQWSVGFGSNRTSNREATARISKVRGLCDQTQTTVDPTFFYLSKLPKAKLIEENPWPIFSTSKRSR